MTSTAAANHADIAAAVGIIHDVVFDVHPHDEHDVATAHTTLARHRGSLTGPLRDAIDDYLADDTWHQGPHVLRHTIRHLGHLTGIPDPSTPTICEQPTLF